MDKASLLDLPTFVQNEKVELQKIKEFKKARYEAALKQIPPLEWRSFIWYSWIALSGLGP